MALLPIFLSLFLSGSHALMLEGRKLAARGGQSLLNAHDSGFLTNITLGGETLEVVVDLGRCVPVEWEES